MLNYIILKALLFFFLVSSTNSSFDGPLYDSYAYSKCKVQPEEPLYGGGMLKGQNVQDNSYFLQNLIPGNKYCFSIWIKLTNGSDSALIRASLQTEKKEIPCIGTVISKAGCWSFLKGGFELSSPSDFSKIHLKSADGKYISVEVAGASLQPFTDEQWKWNQELMINKERKRDVAIHVADTKGMKVAGASITVEQISREFPLGCAIAYTIIGNPVYQKWFLERFNVASFENELKWRYTEAEKGKFNYDLPDQMLAFLRANRIVSRGHTMLWEIRQGQPNWVQNLTGVSLREAAESRIDSMMSKYRGEFIHWDVNNEELHYDFFRSRLGHDATLEFFKTLHQRDPHTRLFLNDYNVIEGCTDNKCTVDTMISRMRELHEGGARMEGIGLEGHFGQPNPPLIRGILDKLATLEIPIWFTELDINITIDLVSQAKHIDAVLREGFSHPAVSGIVLWSAITKKNGCYNMCLTDRDFNKNLPAGDAVDSLLKEWHTGVVKGCTDELGVFNFNGFLGDYTLKVEHEGRTSNTTFSLNRGRETKHWEVVV